MIIGHYDSELWSHGGIATYIRRLSRGQRAAGHTVYFFSHRPASPTDPAERPIIVTSNDDLYTRAHQLKVDILHLHKGVFQSPTNGLPVIRTLHGHQPYCPSGSKFLKQSNQPCDRAYSVAGCLWGHFIDRCGSIRPPVTRFNFNYTEAERLTLAQMPVITVSQFLRHQLIQSGLQPQHIHTLWLPAPDQPPYSPPPPTDIPHFAFVGRLTPEKGIDCLLQAVAAVPVPIHLDIAGTGYQEQALHQLTEQLGIRDRVTFWGWLQPTQIKPLMQSARALVFPSRWHEPAGFISLEAAAIGRAVITTQVGGIPEYTDRLDNACLVPPNDVAGLAAAITQLATDRDCAIALGSTGYANLNRHFHLDSHLTQLGELYAQTMHKPTQREMFLTKIESMSMEK